MSELHSRAACVPPEALDFEALAAAAVDEGPAKEEEITLEPAAAAVSWWLARGGSNLSGGSGRSGHSRAPSRVALPRKALTSMPYAFRYFGAAPGRKL